MGETGKGASLKGAVNPVRASLFRMMYKTRGGVESPLENPHAEKNSNFQSYSFIC